MILDGAAFRSLVAVGDPEAVADDEQLYVCRLVFDPDEDMSGPIRDLSCFGHSIASSMRFGHGIPDAQESLRRAREMVIAGDIEVVEMTETEFRLTHVIAFEARATRPLGIATAAAATIAIGRCRSWPIMSADADVFAFLASTGTNVVAFPT